MNCVQKMPRKRGLKTIPNELTCVSFSVGVPARFVIGTLQGVTLRAAQKMDAATRDLEHRMALIWTERNQLIEEFDQGRFLQQPRLSKPKRIEDFATLLVMKEVRERNLESLGELAHDLDRWIPLLVLDSANKGRGNPREIF